MGIDLIREPLVGMKRQKVRQFFVLKNSVIPKFPKFQFKIEPPRNRLCGGKRFGFLSRFSYKYGYTFFWNLV